MNWSPDIYAKAWYFSTLAHQSQTYGGRTEGVNISYLNHIGSVAMEVLNAVGLTSDELDADLAIQCALLHDIIEDTNFTYTDIETEFGQQVADGVLALTKDESISSKTEKMMNSLHRIKQQPYEIWMVKMADRLCNLYHPPYYWDNNKISAYQEEAIVIYENLKEADEALAARLWTKILAYRKFIQ